LGRDSPVDASCAGICKHHKGAESQRSTPTRQRSHAGCRPISGFKEAHMVGGGDGVSPIVALERRERRSRSSRRRKDLECRSLVVFAAVGRVAHVGDDVVGVPPYISNPPPMAEGAVTAFAGVESESTCSAGEAPSEGVKLKVWREVELNSEGQDQNASAMSKGRYCAH
jgi:hypothetical protein